MITLIERYIYLLWVVVVFCLLIIFYRFISLRRVANKSAAEMAKSLPQLKEHLAILGDRAINVSTKTLALSEKMENLMLSFDDLTKALNLFNIFQKVLSDSIDSIYDSLQ